MDASIGNHLPMGASVSFYFGRSKDSVFSAPELIIGPVTALAGELEAATGLVKSSRLSTNKISLSDEQLGVFETTPLFAGVLVEFPGTNGQIVRVMRSDFMEIKAVISVNFTVDPDSKD